MNRTLRLLLVALAALGFATGLVADDSPDRACSRCIGIDAPTSPAEPAVPLLLEVDAADPSSAAGLLDAMTPDARRLATVVAHFAIDETTSTEDADARVGELVAWLKSRAPLGAVGIRWDENGGPVRAFALKRLSVQAQGLGIASTIVLEPASRTALENLYEQDAQAYVDAILVGADDVESTFVWIAENDPVKRIWARVDASSPNPLFDAAAALANGATHAFVHGVPATFAPVAAAWNAEVTGDFSPISTPDEITMLHPDGKPAESRETAFIRGKDLRTYVVPEGDAAKSMILSFDGTDRETPRRVDPSGSREITDRGVAGGRYLVGVPPTRAAFYVTIDRAQVEAPNVTREKIEVVGQKTIPVEEIVRNHQAYWSYQESAMPRYIAHNETSLRFAVGQTGESIEATLSGDHFFGPKGISDWVWSDFYVNGVKWKYGKIPELPLIQPEKVTQLPLDIHLTKEYRYRLVRETTLRGWDVYEVAFEPPPNAPETLPLYRGTVWIDKKTWARVAISMIQLNLQGDVLSNEERIEFAPFDRATHEELDANAAAPRIPSGLAWLPVEIRAQQVLSAAGRATPVERSTIFTDFRIDPRDFDARLAEADNSRSRMVRDTDDGLRYLERTEDGKRVVKEGFDKSRLFLVGGLYRDPGLEYAVIPLGGIDYFNFDLWGRGLQTNVFFAGVILSANLTNPSLFGSRFNAGVDVFGLAIPFENTMFRGGEEVPEEAVKARPLNATVRVGHPLFGFGKADLSLSISHVSFESASTTAPDFTVPTNTFVLSPSLSLEYDRRGWNLSGFYEWNHRTDWKPWGIASEYDPAQKDFSKWGASVGKTFFLPKFQRIGVAANWVDGDHLDRFSKYELGFFGGERVRGVRSGSVRAEQAVFGHLSYGFVFSKQFRIESFYDIALVDDTTSGYSRERFQGVGLAGQTVGPWGTIVRFDLGRGIGTNAQGDVIASLVFLKLFD